ncbi:MAG: clostripain-related cysteine peptidase, partial [Eubacteriales bacterium]|nr:clostripain-related cysteine peptidase [Eubacteriales bacterium]
GSALYMVASEELEPYLGWNYEGWMSAVGQDPGISTEDWAKAIVDAYYEACMFDNPNDYISQSVIYLPGMIQLTQSTELFSQYLVQALEAGEMRTVSRGRQQMYSFGKFADSSSDMVDMMALVNAYRSFAPNAATRVEQALSRAVVYSVGSDMYDSLCGLSILLPQETCDYFDNYIEAYDYNQVFPNYTDFVKGYVKLMKGGSYSFSVQAPEKLDTADMQAPAFTGSLSNAVFTPSSSFVADESGDAAEETEEPAEEPTEEPTEEEQPEETPEEQPEEEVDQPAQSGGSFFSTADSYAPTVSAEGGEASVLPNGLPASYDPNTAYAYSLTLSQEDLENLSYVEGMLLMDVSDEEGAYYVDLGYTQNAWVDWDAAQVYSLFDGRWPMMGDQLVAIYDQVKTAAMRRSIVPVTLNGAEGYLVVVFNAEHPEGKIAGFSVGYDENGLPARGVTQLKEGDEVVPRYTLLYYDENDEVQEASFLGDPITVDADGLPFGYESLEGGEATYQYCFCLNDVFGGEQYSDFVAFEL